MNRTWMYALIFCAVAAFLEHVFAGPGVRRQLLEIKLPRFAPPFWGWIIVGICYYATALLLLVRLLPLPSSPLRTVSLVLVSLVLFLNVLWNLFFFRRRDFGQALAISAVYSVVSGALCAVLFDLDTVTALMFLPYVLYLAYAISFGYVVWRLNVRL